MPFMLGSSCSCHCNCGPCEECVNAGIVVCVQDCTGTGFRGFVDSITGGAIDSITVSQGGQNYAQPKRVVPQLELDLLGPPFGGTGATFAFTVQERGTSPKTWRLIGVEILTAGSGYFEPFPVSVDVTNRDAIPFFLPDPQTSATVDVTTDGAGAIVGVAINNEGIMWGESTTEGEACKIDMRIVSGRGGRDAVVDPVVDTNPASGTFGQITAVTVVDGGSGYNNYAEVPQPAARVKLPDGSWFEDQFNDPQDISFRIFSGTFSSVYTGEGAYIWESSPCCGGSGPSALLIVGCSEQLGQVGTANQVNNEWELFIRITSGFNNQFTGTLSGTLTCEDFDGLALIKNNIFDGEVPIELFNESTSQSAGVFTVVFNP